MRSAPFKMAFVFTTSCIQVSSLLYVIFIDYYLFYIYFKQFTFLCYAFSNKCIAYMITFVFTVFLSVSRLVSQTIVPNWKLACYVLNTMHCILYSAYYFIKNGTVAISISITKLFSFSILYILKINFLIYVLYFLCSRQHNLIVGLHKKQL